MATFQTAALVLMPHVISELTAAYPHLRLEITQIDPDNALSALAARDFDLVLGEEYPGIPYPRLENVEIEELFRDPMRLLLPSCRPELTRADGLQDVRDIPWIMEPKGNAARAWAVAVCREADVEPDVRYESNDLLVHVRLVEAGYAWRYCRTSCAWRSGPQRGTCHCPGTPHAGSSPPSV